MQIVGTKQSPHLLHQSYPRPPWTLPASMSRVEYLPSTIHGIVQWVPIVHHVAHLVGACRIFDCIPGVGIAYELHFECVHRLQLRTVWVDRLLHPAVPRQWQTTWLNNSMRYCGAQEQVYFYASKRAKETIDGFAKVSFWLQDNIWHDDGQHSIRQHALRPFQEYKIYKQKSSFIRIQNNSLMPHTLSVILMCT